jgi:hypothetical protein
MGIDKVNPLSTPSSLEATPDSMPQRSGTRTRAKMQDILLACPAWEASHRRHARCQGVGPMIPLALFAFVPRKRQDTSAKTAPTPRLSGTLCNLGIMDNLHPLSGIPQHFRLVGRYRRRKVKKRPKSLEWSTAICPLELVERAEPSDLHWTMAHLH